MSAYLVLLLRFNAFQLIDDVKQMYLIITCFMQQETTLEYSFASMRRL